MLAFGLWLGVVGLFDLLRATRDVITSWLVALAGAGALWLSSGPS